MTDLDLKVPKSDRLYESRKNDDQAITYQTAQSDSINEGKQKEPLKFTNTRNHQKQPSKRYQNAIRDSTLTDNAPQMEDIIET